MSRLFSTCLAAIVSSLLMAPPDASAQVNPGPISWRYTGYPESMEWWLEYETLPGWNYVIEESQDLQTWSPMAGGFAYGDGGLKRRFIIHDPVPPEPGADPPPPAEPESEAPAKQYFNISWKVTLSADPASPTIHLKREAAVGFAAWDAVLDIPLPRPPEGSRICQCKLPRNLWCCPALLCSPISPPGQKMSMAPQEPESFLTGS